MGSPYASPRPGWAFPRCRVSDPEWWCGFTSRTLPVSLAPGGVSIDGQVFDPSIFPTTPRARLAVALGLVRARQRMARFVAWLRLDLVPLMVEQDLPLYMSPEHFVVRAGERRDWTRLRWIAGTLVGGRWNHLVIVAQRNGDADGLVAGILASPEWKRLPWQRDPEAGRSDVEAPEGKHWRRANGAHRWHLVGLKEHDRATAACGWAPRSKSLGRGQMRDRAGWVQGTRNLRGQPCPTCLANANKHPEEPPCP
jgi:hypothetical protein